MCVSGTNTPLTHTVKDQAYSGSLIKRVWASVLAPLARGLNEIYVFSSMRTAFRKIDNWECAGGGLYVGSRLGCTVSGSALGS